MGNYFVGCLAYENDLTIIAPSRKALQTMFSVCEGYAADYEVIFSGPKSQFLIFKGKECQATDCQIVVNIERLNNVTSAVYLGPCISTLNKNSLIDAADSGKVLTFSQLTLVIYTHSCNVDYFLSIPVDSMEHHYGILYITITFVLLGEKHLAKCGMYHL